MKVTKAIELINHLKDNNLLEYISEPVYKDGEWEYSIQIKPFSSDQAREDYYKAIKYGV